jgi:hypothetical protein
MTELGGEASFDATEDGWVIILAARGGNRHVASHQHLRLDPHLGDRLLDVARHAAAAPPRGQKAEE